MSSRLLVLVITAALAGQSVQPSAPARPPAAAAMTAGTAAISGVVTDAVTGKPVAGAFVSLLGPANVVLPRTTTDSRGRFVFRDLPASPDYYLNASAFGYAATRYGWKSPNGSVAIRDIVRIPLTDGQWVSTISIPLWRLGSIGGRVLDERGEPVVGVAVRVFSTANIAGQQQLVAGQIATTDDRGVYRTGDLEPGRYVVGVLSVQSTVLDTTPDAPQRRAIGELESGAIMSTSGSPVAGPSIDVDGRHRLVMSNFATPPPPSAGQGRAYPALFYPAARNPSDAVAVEIGYGDNRAAVDLQLTPVSAVRVSGRLDGLGGPAPELLLRLLPAGAERLGFGAEAATTVLEPNGAFTFLNVPEGSYTILAQASVMDFTTGSSSPRFFDAPGFPGNSVGVGSLDGAPGLTYLDRGGNGAPVWGRQPIAVGSRDITDVIVAMHPTVSIRGRMVLTEGMAPPRAGARLFLRATPANGDPALGHPGGVTETDGSLRFAVSGLIGGTYLLSGFSGSIVSIVWQGRDLANIGFDASAGRDFDDVIVTLTDKKADVSGIVTDRRARVDAAVLVFPVEREQWINFGWEPRRIRSTTASSTGAYAFTLPAGDYYAIAVDSSKGTAWLDARFLAAAAPLATRVSLKYGEKTTQHLTLTEVVVR